MSSVNKIIKIYGFGRYMFDNQKVNAQGTVVEFTFNSKQDCNSLEDSNMRALYKRTLIEIKKTLSEFELFFQVLITTKESRLKFLKYVC